MGNTVVVGLQWGDEGKGKLVDEWAPRHAAVVRYHGGANAGHTVVAGGRPQVLHQVPSGALRAGSLGIIAAGCVVDPSRLRAETEALGLDPGRLVVSSRAQVVVPWYRDLDAAEEALRGAQEVGTTGRGIGPAYAAKAGRWGLPVGAFVHDAARAAGLDLGARWTERWRRALGVPLLPWSEADALARWLAPFVADDLRAMEVAAARGPLLFEGHLGLMRDPDRGAYPQVTGASLLPPAALVGAESLVVGVAKPYLTAVGGGDLPTEVTGAEADRIRALGGEFGATTGRPRRVGWLDLPALRYAVRAAGATRLAVQMKVDALAGRGAVPVCVAYADWDERAGYPLAHQMARVRPIYADWPLGGGERGAVEFARRMAAAVGLPLAYVGTGAARGACVEWP